MTSRHVTWIIIVFAVAAIIAVVLSNVDFGDDETPDPRPQTPDPSPQTSDLSPQSSDTSPQDSDSSSAEVPDNPDDVRGTDGFALNRPANFRRALTVLERERKAVNGVFDSLRLAPGRIDTTIIHPDDRMTNIQVRADLKISSKFTHDFPTQADFRKDGLSAGEVDTGAPARLLRQFDAQRQGSATEDVDYCVIDKDIIDFRVNISCYMRLRTARPRSFLKEAGEELRVIG